ncbi:MAG: glycosyltransferase [Cycloclasticus sp.]|nr:glycosyltransferase [Cycloclasticus sp.]
MSINLAPIVLFVYNRPWHTQQTIEALQKNELASESELFIYSDAAKTEQDCLKVAEVRDYIHAIEGFKKITIIEREKNWGLADSIIDGVTAIVNEYGKIIVLEDDLVTSPYFLEFMNDALGLYEKNKNVGMIHGHIYYIEGLPEVFFLQKSGCLGWATWDSAWNEVSFDGGSLLHEIKKKGFENDFDINNSYPFTKMLGEQVEGKNSSWAIRVQASFFLKKILTFYPSKSLVQHIGFDIGTHCNGALRSSDMDGRLFSKRITAKVIKADFCTEATKKLEFFLKKQKRPLLKRVIQRVLRSLHAHKL